MYIIKAGKCLAQLTFNYKKFLLFFPLLFFFSFSKASSISISGEMNISQLKSSWYSLKQNIIH